MSTASALLLLFVSAAVTYSARAGLILLISDRPLPALVERALSHVGPAVLSALAVSLAVGGEGIDALSLAEAVALVVAGALAVWTRSLIWTFAGGLAILLILDAVT